MTATPSGRRLIGLSTKMYFSISRHRQVTADFLERLSKLAPSSLSHVDIFIVPDFVSLAETAEQVKKCPVPVWAGAQDCHWEDSGAFTGEVSPSVLGEAGVKIVEVGHAERRRLFGENDATVALKAAAVSRNGMIPLVCIGEQTKGDISVAIEECSAQIRAVLGRVPPTAEVALAYEPVWAIGATEPAGEQHVLKVVAGIRQLDCVKSRVYERLTSGLDGLFLGRFGHDPERFVEMIREVAEA